MSQLPVRTDEAPTIWPYPYSMFCIASMAGLVAALIFLAFPGIDLGFSRLFYLGNGHFLFERPSFGSALRDLLRLIFWLACLGAIVGFIMTAFFNRKIMGVRLIVWAYIAACAAVGPGLVANLTFKDHWGRARPVHVTQFGGAKQFTPPLVRTDQCEKNCSFISGEASNYYMLGFAIAFLAPPFNRRNLLLAGIAAGSFVGFIRIGGGAHFLSDVVFAAIFMAFVARGLAWLMLERYGLFFADRGPLHQMTLRLGRKGAVRTLQFVNKAKRDWLPKR